MLKRLFVEILYSINILCSCQLLTCGGSIISGLTPGHWSWSIGSTCRSSIIRKALIFIGAMIDFSYRSIEWLVGKSIRKGCSATTGGSWRSNRWRPISKLAISIVGGTSSAATTYLLIWITDARWWSIISKLTRWRAPFQGMFKEYRIITKSLANILKLSRH